MREQESIGDPQWGVSIFLKNTHKFPTGESEESQSIPIAKDSTSETLKTFLFRYFSFFPPPLNQGGTKTNLIPRTVFHFPVAGYWNPLGPDLEFKGGRYEEEEREKFGYKKRLKLDDTLKYDC